MRLVVALAAVLLVPSLSVAAEDPKVRLERAEKENEKLKEQLGKGKAEAEAAFKAATDAENAAGLRGLSCHAVSSASAPANYPVTGVIHVKLRLKRGTWVNRPSFAAPNAVKSFRVHAGTCQVTKS